MFHLRKFPSVILVLQWVTVGLNAVEEKKPAPNKLVEVPLIKINNNYYGDIIVGTPHANEGNQVFRVNFDTGSQHLWLMSKERCPTPDCTEVDFTPYDKSKSTTYRKINTRKPFSLGYADGTIVTGSLGWDYITLGKGGAKVRINQTIGFASEVKGIIEDCDGIFGLGLLSESLFPGSPDPPMWTLNKEYGIEEFGIYLARVLSGSGAGKLVFGGHDESLIEGEMQWHDVELVDGKFDGYKIKIDKIIVRKGEHHTPTEGGEKDYEVDTGDMLALPDSGNNVIIGPKEMFNSIKAHIISYATFEYSNTYSFMCDENVDELPNLIFVMNGREYVMYPRDYIWTLKSGTLCKLGIFGMDTDHIVLGQIFMQTFYTKFNVIEQTVGFARAKHPKQ